MSDSIRERLVTDIEFFSQIIEASLARGLELPSAQGDDEDVALLK